MSVAARVAREMGVKLGNEVRSLGFVRGKPLSHCSRDPIPQVWALVTPSS